MSAVEKVSKKKKRKAEAEAEVAAAPKKVKKSKKQKVEETPVAEAPKKVKKSKKEKKVDEPAAEAPKKVKKSKKSKNPAAEEPAAEIEIAKVETPAAGGFDLSSLKKKSTFEEKQEAEANLQPIMIACRDCSEEFEFSVDDQQWHIDQGFDNQPSRCRPCQKAKKERMNGGPPPCYAFNDGNCDRGDSCKFSHGGNSGGGGGGGGRGGRGGHGRGGRGGGRGGGGKCFKFQEGNCTFGDSCRFTH